jgi:hypothetical protein
MKGRIKSVVLLVHSKFLGILEEKGNDLITMIWPGGGKKGTRMADPFEWIKRGDQEAVPFLYRGTENKPPFEVTHIALGIYIGYREDNVLNKARVEVYCNEKWSNKGVTTWYVITGTRKLDKPIRYDELELVNTNRKLNPNFIRGYAKVYLPDNLIEWYTDTISKNKELVSDDYNERLELIKDRINRA